MSESYSVCVSCGKQVEYAECSEGESQPDNPRCQALTGWYSVSKWKGIESFDQYDFCSLDCLREWIDKQMPKIPEEYLRNFEKGSGEGGG
ncbi:MAG: hypothetical protein AB1638_06285 [Nitrospirota bacterium]